MRNLIVPITLSLALSSCSCSPEKLAKVAFTGMEAMMGEGFMPSEEIRALGDFQGMSVGLSQNSTNGESESTIFLKLENGNPKKLAERREILARQCAELYLRDFENTAEYQKITVQFIQSDPSNSENVAVEDYTFEVGSF